MRGDEEVRKADDRSKEDAFSSKEDTFSGKDEDISRALLFKRKQSTPCNFRFFEDTDNESPLVKIKIPPATPSENGSSYNFSAQTRDRKDHFSGARPLQLERNIECTLNIQWCKQQLSYGSI
ncbi:hypothetical protein GE061_004957 [Apolygus lucorum]|uniref:Uncharacterized protein n=1 Tax=Apolygus lucorum TaxID=248454 RepID=A0A8S9WWA6_APOLU|nr:hypothetical protein GE061_004957 [Apolygus lucorum]